MSDTKEFINPCPRYFTIGNITLDDIVLPDGTVRFGSFGGGAIYSAVGARIWSSERGDIGVVSRVGAEYPQENIDQLHDAGLDIRGVTRVDLPTIRCWLLYEGARNRQIVFRLYSGRSPELDPKHFEVIPEYLNASFVHIAPMAVSSQLEMVGLLRSRKIPFSLDLTVVGSEVDPKEIINLDGLRGCDIFLPSFQEVQAIWDSQPLHLLLENISRAGPKVIAIKMGDQGSIVYDVHADRGFRVPIVPVEVVDTTGAGDAYCGGFMVGFHKTNDALEAALMGTVSASYAIQGYSAWQMLQADISKAQDRLDRVKALVEPI